MSKRKNRKTFFERLLLQLYKNYCLIEILDLLEAVNFLELVRM